MVYSPVIQQKIANMFLLFTKKICSFDNTKSTNFLFLNITRCNFGNNVPSLCQRAADVLEN